MIIQKIPGDFSSGVNVEQFHEEITNSSITTSLIGITETTSTVNIEFDGTLDSGETTTLNNLISSHIPVERIIYSTVDTINLSETTYRIKSKNTKLLTFYKYRGSDRIGTLKKIEFYGYITSGNYQIIIISGKTGKKLYDGYYSNNTMTKNVITNFTNIPAKEEMLQIKVKNSSKQAISYFNSITFCC